MTTPRGVKLDENVLVVVKDDLVEFVRDQGEDGLVLRSRDGRALQGGGQVAPREILDKALDGGGVQLGPGGGEDVLFTLGGHVLEHHGGEVFHGDREGFPVLGKLDGVDPDKVDLALVLLGQGFQSLHERLFRGTSRVDEQVGEGQTSLGVDGIVFGRDLVDEGQSVFGDERRQGVFVLGVALVDVHPLVEFLVEDDAVRREIGRCQSLIRDGTKEVAVTKLVGDEAERLGDARVGVVGHDDAVRASETSQVRSRIRIRFCERDNDLHSLQSLELVVVGRVDLGNSRKGLPITRITQTSAQVLPSHDTPPGDSLEHITDDPIALPRTAIVRRRTRTEDLQRGVPADPVLLA